jgi:hypothetical protein
MLNIFHDRITHFLPIDRYGVFDISPIFIEIRRRGNRFCENFNKLIV